MKGNWCSCRAEQTARDQVVTKKTSSSWPLSSARSTDWAKNKIGPKKQERQLNTGSGGNRSDMSKRIWHPKKTQSTHQVPTTDFKIGDCIVVKPGVKDPDYGIDISGWQGRVTEIESYQPSKITIMFQWDSLSLKHIPASMIRRSEEDGLDWTTMGLYPEEVERAEPRDTQDDVDALIEELSEEHAWDYLGKQGQGIQQVLREVDKDDDMEAFEAWQEYLEARLKLPFEAVVSEYQERGPLQAGDTVKVVGFEGVEDLYGVLVNIQAGRNSYVFPLCDLKAVIEKSANFTLTDDYAVWFANR